MSRLRIWHGMAVILMLAPVLALARGPLGQFAVAAVGGGIMLVGGIVLALRTLVHLFERAERIGGLLGTVLGLVSAVAFLVGVVVLMACFYIVALSPWFLAGTTMPVEDAWHGHGDLG